VIRPPAVAGVFYPADPDELRKWIVAALADADAGPADQSVPKAIIAPHAGYIYSGEVAASVYARVARARGSISRVVLLGPAHRVPLDRIAAAGADVFATPLGLMSVDVEVRDSLVYRGLIELSDAAHRDEHGLEVHLPFLQVALGAVMVLPLIVGAVPAEAVVAVLNDVWGGPETLIVVSTDLSHYHDHATAQALDRETTAAILARQPQAVGTDRACGVFALRGLLASAAERDLNIELVDLRTSGDTAGDRDRVVGYGAFAVT
jgi:AmmeMemoRadiSam system protein B